MQAIRDPYYRPAIIAVVGVMTAQQFTGINSIIMYSVSLLQSILPTTAALLTVLISAINLVMTLACSPLPDRIGRKTCLLLSIAGMGASSILLALGIYFNQKIASAIAALLFVACFAVGLGPVPFILASELVGPEAVGAAQSCALAANWTATFVVAQFFPVLNDALGGRGKVYWVFAAMAGLLGAFIYRWVPETKGKANADEVWGRTDRRQD
jgi:MFS family permease